MFMSLDSVVEAARRRLAALTPEVAGYVVLRAARRLEPRPSRVSPSGILLTDGGDVQCRPDSVATELEVEAALRQVLETLLELSPSPVPAITAVAEGSSAGSLSAFAEELSAALIPINHAAAQRALARLYRETLRAGGPELEPAPARDSAAELSAEPMPMRPKPAPTAPELTPEPPPVVPVAVYSGAKELDIDVELDTDPELEAPLVTPERVPPVEPIAEATLGTPEQAIAVAPTMTVTDALPEIAEPAPESVAAASSNGATKRRRERRSDVRELLLRFLAEARSDERKMRKLRAMIGIEDDGAPASDDEPSAI
jgi:hypothetical protein